MLRRWDELPAFMQTEAVRPYWESLYKKRINILIKRLFDILFGCFFLLLLAIPMIIIAVAIKFDSPGTVFYRQERVTQYGKKFRIHKFRTMIDNADKYGVSITVDGDKRITRFGKIIRKYRIDELPQLLDVVVGNMSFVGTRPEVTKYVEHYSDEMYATLLLPAGITSETSILYKDEGRLLYRAYDADRVYVEDVLPEKMKYNLASIIKFTFLNDLIVMIRTFFAVIK